MPTPTVIANNFEGGTNSIAVTQGNSGGASGTAFSAMSSTGLKFDSAAAFQGSMGASVAGGLAGAGRWDVSSSQASPSIKFRIDATPTADQHLMRIHNSAGTRIASVHISAPGTNTGKLRIDDNTGTTGIFTFANACAVGTWYRLEAWFVCGADATHGTLKVAYYLGNSPSPVETAYVNTAANVGTGLTIGQVMLGKFSTTAEQYSFDEFKLSTDAGDLLTLAMANTPPIVSTPAIQNVNAGDAVTVSVTASSTSASITSYAWSYLYPSSGGPALSGATTATVSFTASSTAGKLYKLQCVVTDSNGLSTTVATEVRVPTAGDATVLPGTAEAAVGSWSNVGGGATPGDAMADTLDTTYLESPNLSASGVSWRQRVAPFTARNPMQFNIKLSEDTVGASTIKVRVYEGTTMRQEWTQAVDNTWQVYPFAVTNPAAISDTGNVFIEFYGTAP